MPGNSNPARIGTPQLLAGMLLLVFLAQCGWLLVRNCGAHAPLPEPLSDAVLTGIEQLHGKTVAGDPVHSPLWYLQMAIPAWIVGGASSLVCLIGVLALPQIALGVLLGASLWYVARRLYGNAGGYIALALYCFSPGVLRASALWFAQPEMGAAWGAFGAVFTAIAVAHTLYAPREVVLWNWRRILLLGLSFALAVGCQFSLLILVFIALGFLLYLAWERAKAAFAIWAAAAAVALALLSAAYFFDFGAMRKGMQQAQFFGLQWRAYLSPLAYRGVAQRLAEISPALVLAVPAALAVYAVWPRARYFGNTAPLLVSAILMAFACGTPHAAGYGFSLIAAPFLLVFVSGIAADLLETEHRTLASICLVVLIALNALLNNALFNLRALAFLRGHSFQ